VVGWQDVVLSFLPPAKRTMLARERLLAYRLPLILAIQSALTLRLNDIASDDEGLYIHGGHVVIAHLLHGGTANAALLRFYGSFFSGAPNLYPVAAAVLDSAGGLLLVRIFSLLLMLIATWSVHRIGRYLFTENVGLWAALVFALTGSVQYIGKYATFDSPCLTLLAVAAASGITRRSVSSAVLAGIRRGLETPDERAIAFTQTIHPAIHAAEEHAALPDGGWRIDAPTRDEVPQLFAGGGIDCVEGVRVDL